MSYLLSQWIKVKTKVIQSQDMYQYLFPSCKHSGTFCNECYMSCQKDIKKLLRIY